MKLYLILYITLLITAFSCNSPEQSKNIGNVDSAKIVDPATKLDTAESSERVDTPIKKFTGNQELYDFMNKVIAVQKLNRGYGLTIEAEPQIDISDSDAAFLNKMEINEESQDTSQSLDLSKLTFSSSMLPQVLTKEDIEFMLEQKKKYKDFKWDNSKLGFNLANEYNWYAFSVPLFSKDKCKAVMTIRDLCRGLCGSGYTVLFEYEDGRWVSHQSNSWFH